MQIVGRDMASELKEAEKQLQQVRADLEKAIKLIEEETHPAAEPGTQPVLGPDGQPVTEPANQATEPAPEPKLPGSARGIETLFKSSYRVQMDLTGLADNKANMMISINGIIMSIMLASVAPKLDNNPWLFLPTLFLLVGNLVSMIFAILAARPRVSHDPISLTDLKNSKGNILFFGNFANMSPTDFVSGMEELMDDRVLTYDTMIRNIHSLGSVLNKKFALLQVAYTSFMVALSLGVTSFLVVFIWLSLRSP
ncbi:MAG TPA: Pycsar system effector family protein [Xanthomonadales bacterium]|nr:Pycsar system effector family protein [Xanthomonadales bacterium]